MEVQVLIGWLKIRCCFAATASSWGIHILDYKVDAGLKALKVHSGAVACCCRADVVLSDETDSLLQPLQFQSMRRLYGAPLLQGS